MASREFHDQLIQFLPKMRVWAFALTRNPAVADDLVQDVALKTLMANDRFICAFRRKAAGHSDRIQPVIPTQTSHRFRGKPAALEGVGGAV
jgi:hypothetical protein